ncbi:polymorphic toxin-type HINT domain-containing protein [Amycolatopsis sp. NPDC059021]|uniref:polymorphic toxin-type HINT domain-containing protein n=1 Tax=Amycolatopsis sp. NPDC059021 TaxID=3346704 RepID=UPI00366AAE1A
MSEGDAMEPGFTPQPRFGQQAGYGGAWPPPLPVPPAPRRGRRKALVLGGIGLVVALVAGLTTWLAWPSPEANRAPFEQALANLAAARGVHYTSELGGMKWDITTTAFGERFGTFGRPGSAAGDQDLLAVEGKVYTKSQRDKDKGPLGKWRTGEAGETGLYRPMLDRFAPPYLLAARLSAALDDQRDLPSPDDADLPGLDVAGVPALRADTTQGTLYVAKNAPYRVLRLVPAGEGRQPGLPGLTGPPSLPRRSSIPDWPGGTSAPPVPSGPHTAPAAFRPAAQQGAAGSGGIDVSPVAADQADRMYDTLADNTQQLAGAVDASIDFSVAGNGTMNCGPGGCTVQASFTGTLSADAKTRITGGQVTATMTATVSINGRPAGGCASPPGVFPITGNTVAGQLSCADPEAGAVFTAVESQLKAQAQAESRASGGRPVPYTITGTGQAEVSAMAVAQAEVERLIGEQREERRAQPCATPNSFVPGTRVLLADGTSRPIEQLTPGTLVRTADPATGTTTAEPVLARIAGSGPKQLDRLTLGDGRRSGTVTATANHPFWDPDRRAWVDAGDLRPGETLATLPGAEPVRVTGVGAEQRELTVYNLTVAGTHTYFVLAGDVPVLVHNQDEDGSPAGTIVDDSGVKIQIYSNDHGPAHAHVKGGGKEVRIGQNGKPLAGDPELSKQQAKVVQNHLGDIRDAIRYSMRKYRENEENKSKTAENRNGGNNGGC